MELIEGRNLRSLLREEGRRPIVEVIEIGMQLCEALDLLHGRGVIHRDLTPRNVLVDEHAATDDARCEAERLLDQARMSSSAQLVADLTLDNAILKDVASGNF